MSLTRGAIHRSTLKNKVLSWIYRNWPRIDQWAIKSMDKYPCNTCIHFDTYGCLMYFTVNDCIYESITVEEKVSK